MIDHDEPGAAGCDVRARGVHPHDEKWRNDPDQQRTRGAAFLWHTHEGFTPLQLTRN